VASRLCRATSSSCKRDDQRTAFEVLPRATSRPDFAREGRPVVQRPPRLDLQLTPPPASSDRVPYLRIDPEGSIDLRETEVIQKAVLLISQADFRHHNVRCEKNGANCLVVPWPPHGHQRSTSMNNFTIFAHRYRAECSVRDVNAASGRKHRSTHGPQHHHDVTPKREGPVMHRGDRVNRGDVRGHVPRSRWSQSTGRADVDAAMFRRREPI
jgi:hypothetical protein